MTEYTVKKPFMARVGQFDPDKHTLCIGIECNALKKSDYRCYIGNNKNDYYDMTYDRALQMVAEYGEKNVCWHIRGKEVYILPIKNFSHGQHQEENEAV